jgi:flagellar biosynthesis protein FliR
VIALKLSAPIVIIMLIVNIILGFIYKAVPQMNIFFVGQPVYIFIGFLTMLISLPVFVYLMQGYFGSMKDDIGRVILLMQK